MVEATDRPTYALRMFLVATMAAAWPWEVFQQLPVIDITLVRFCGVCLIALVLVDAATRGTLVIPKTGIEIPLVALLLVCAVSGMLSVDSASSWRMFAAYCWYAVLFYAIAHSVRSVPDAIALLRVFLLSAAAVALAAVFCSLGVLAPVHAEFARQVGNRVAWDTAAGSLMRMAATSPDFNQGVLAFLIAVPIALLLVPRSRAELLAKSTAIVLLLGGMLAAYSRSSLAIALCTIGAYGIYRMLRFRGSARGGLVVVLVAIAIALAATPFLSSLGGRLSRGLSGEEASINHRVYGYRVAAEIAPHFLLTGTGLAASDRVIAEYADPEKSGGLTLHSVPFKFLIETGVAGLVAYLWLWGQGIAVLWRRLLRSGDTDTKRLGAAAVLGGAMLFAITAIQPFTQLSLFPILMGVVFGPAAINSAKSMPRVRARSLFAAACLTAAVVLPNAIGYQVLARQVSQFAAEFQDGLERESRGEWTAAAATYGDAISTLGTAPDHRYFQFAAETTDIPWLLAQARVGSTGATPQGATLFCAGRALLSAGELDAAYETFQEAAKTNAIYAATNHALAIQRIVP